MESLSDTIWDVVLSGTSLPQSLLALYVSSRAMAERAIYLTDPDEGLYPGPARKCYTSTRMTTTEAQRLL